MSEQAINYIINNATFNATVTSANIPNDGKTAWVLVVNTGAVTTTPTLTPEVDESYDGGTTWFRVGAAITAVSTQSLNRYLFTVGSTQGPIVAPLLRVVCTFGSAGNFAGTTVILSGIDYGR